MTGDDSNERKNVMAKINDLGQAKPGSRMLKRGLHHQSDVECPERKAGCGNQAAGQSGAQKETGEVVTFSHPYIYVR